MSNVILEKTSFIIHSFRPYFSLRVMPYYYGFSILGLIALLVFESYYLGWEKSSLKRITVRPSPSAKLDIAHAVMYVLNISPFLAFLMSFGLGTLIPVTVKKYFGFNIVHSLPNPWAQAIIYTLVYDFSFYWKHRFSHEWKWWWRLHEMHHSATEMNMITSNRIHAGDEALSRIFVCLPLALVGAPPETYLYIRAASFLQGVLIHTSVPLKWKSFFHYVFVSPLVHQIHHSDLPEHRNKNYGNHLPIWDLLFGTWYTGNNLVPLYADRLEYHRNPWYRDIWSSYCRFCAELLETLKRAISTPPSPNDAKAF